MGKLKQQLEGDTTIYRWDNLYKTGYKEYVTQKANQTDQQQQTEFRGMPKGGVSVLFMALRVLPSWRCS